MIFRYRFYFCKLIFFRKFSKLFVILQSYELAHRIIPAIFQNLKENILRMQCSLQILLSLIFKLIFLRKFSNFFVISQIYELARPKYTHHFSNF